MSESGISIEQNHDSDQIDGIASKKGSIRKLRKVESMDNKNKVASARSINHSTREEKIRDTKKTSIFAKNIDRISKAPLLIHPEKAPRKSHKSKKSEDEFDFDSIKSEKNQKSTDSVDFPPSIGSSSGKSSEQNSNTNDDSSRSSSSSISNTCKITKQPNIDKNIPTSKNVKTLESKPSQLNKNATLLQAKVDTKLISLKATQNLKVNDDLLAPRNSRPGVISIKRFTPQKLSIKKLENMKGILKDSENSRFKLLKRKRIRRTIGADGKLVKEVEWIYKDRFGKELDLNKNNVKFNSEDHVDFVETEYTSVNAVDWQKKNKA